MTETQQYRVVADRDKGDDPHINYAQDGDLLTFRKGREFEPDYLVRIERPVPTTDDWMYEHSDQCRCGSCPTLPASHPPTREQIAEALTEAADEIERILVQERTTLGMSVQDWLRQRAALIQNGADR